MAKIKHLRLHKSATKTMCACRVELLSSLETVVVDPTTADCMNCLGLAVEYHETQAKLAENRLRSMVGQPEKL